MLQGQDQERRSRNHRSQECCRDRTRSAAAGATGARTGARSQPTLTVKSLSHGGEPFIFSVSLRSYLILSICWYTLGDERFLD